MNSSMDEELSPGTIMLSPQITPQKMYHPKSGDICPSIPVSYTHLREEMAKTYEPALYMEEILLRYDNIYRRKKAEKNLADFADIEHYAYEILKDEEAAGFYLSLIHI